MMDVAFKAWWDDYCKSPLDEKVFVAQDAWNAGIDARLSIMQAALEEISTLHQEVEAATANTIAFEALRKVKLESRRTG